MQYILALLHCEFNHPGQLHSTLQWNWFARTVFCLSTALLHTNMQYLD